MSHATRRKLKGNILKGLVYFCAIFTVLLLIELLGYICAGNSQYHMAAAEYEAQRHP